MTLIRGLSSLSSFSLYIPLPPADHHTRILKKMGAQIHSTKVGSPQITVEPLNKGHTGIMSTVPYKEVVLISED